MHLTARGRRGRGTEGPQQREDGAGGRGQRGQETPTLRGTNTSPRRALQEPVLRSPACARLLRVGRPDCPPCGARCPRLAFYWKIAPRAPGGGSRSPLTREPAFSVFSRGSSLQCGGSPEATPDASPLPGAAPQSTFVEGTRGVRCGRGWRSGAWLSPTTQFGRSLNDFAATRCRAAWCFC